MSTEAVGFIGLGLTLILIFMRIWVGVAMALVGLLGFAYLDGWDKALAMVGSEPYTQVANYTFTAIPLFFLMGVLISNTGLGEEVYKSASKWVGQVRGGLAIATVTACGVFAAVCGSSTATAVTMGKVAYPEMKKYKYDDRLAVGALAAGGTIGILIPPSMGFILYGLLTEQSIGKLFMAGIIPGILQVVFYMVTVYVVARMKPDWAPPVSQKVAFKEKVVSLKNTWPVLVLMVVVIGGLYGGIFTPTEAGAIGAVGAIILSLIARKLTWENLRGSITETARTTAMIVMMMIGAFILMRFLAISKMPFMLSDLITGFDVSRWVILAGIVVLYLIIGCFLDIYAGIILTLPIIYPAILGAGFDPIWFGVLMVRLMEVGLISPPFGLNSFVLSSAIKVPVGTIFRGVTPFLIADILHILLLISIPALSLFLVR